MTRRDDARRAAYATKHAPIVEPSTPPAPASAAPSSVPAADAGFRFELDPARARHVRAMQRVYAEELANRRFYFERWGVPFVESELAGYRYRNGDPDR